MSPSNEQLSAFLDAELSPAEMAQVRQAIVAQPELADRLAELAAVDSKVQQFAASIDDSPLSAGLAQSLHRLEQPDVVPLRRRPLPWLAAAASVTAVALLLQLGSGGTASDPWSLVQQRLEQQASGLRVVLADGRSLEVQFSFVAQNGQYCRVYRLGSNNEVQQQLACRSAEWTLMHSETSAAGQGYQTATHSEALDALLDQQMASGAMTLQQEQQLLQNGWRPQP